MPLSGLVSRPYRYNDIKLFLILIPLIAAINYYLTYTNIRLNWRLVITFLIDVQQGYVGWWCSRAMILYMDKIYPFERNPLRRILIQASTTSIVGVVVIVLQTMLVNWLFSDHPIPMIFFTDYTILFFIWFLVLNGIYIGLHYYTEWQNAEDQRKIDLAVRAEGYIVRSGKVNVSIPFGEINGFAVDGEYTVLKTSGAKSYYLDESLDTIEKKLPAELFFRLNRQYLLNRRSVSGFERAENGKINVLLNSTDLFPGSVSVSRLKAAAFKSWFQPE